MGGVMGEFAHFDRETAIAFAEEMRHQRDLAHEELDRLRLELPALRRRVDARVIAMEAWRKRQKRMAKSRAEAERDVALGKLAAIEAKLARRRTDARRLAHMLPLYH